MAIRKKIVEEPKRELLKLEDESQIFALCKRMTNLKLDFSCHMDRQYANQWYETRYLAGVQSRYIMKNGLSINHVGDGVVYRAYNTTDAVAERLMAENPAYKDYFEDLGPFEIPGATEEVAPGMIVEDNTSGSSEGEVTETEETEGETADSETPTNTEVAEAGEEISITEEAPAEEVIQESDK